MERDALRRAAEVIAAVQCVGDINDDTSHGNSDTGGMVFTGAGISVESGIPPFRGQGGLWEVIDPSFVEINHFRRDPRGSWTMLRRVFYDEWGRAEPNAAHRAVAELERIGAVQIVVTQNIDTLHQRAGSQVVVEYHGTLAWLVCERCGARCEATPERVTEPLPRCRLCAGSDGATDGTPTGAPGTKRTGTLDGILKPDVVFFGEPIPPTAQLMAMETARRVPFVLVIGTSGTVMPACQLPEIAREHGATIIEVNPEPSAFTGGVTDLFLRGKATEVMAALLAEVQTIIE